MRHHAFPTRVPCRRRCGRSGRPSLSPALRCRVAGRPARRTTGSCMGTTASASARGRGVVAQRHSHTSTAGRPATSIRRRLVADQQTVEDIRPAGHRIAADAHDCGHRPARPRRASAPGGSRFARTSPTLTVPSGRDAVRQRQAGEDRPREHHVHRHAANITSSRGPHRLAVERPLGRDGLVLARTLQRSRGTSSSNPAIFHVAAEGNP